MKHASEATATDTGIRLFEEAADTAGGVFDALVKSSFDLATWREVVVIMSCEVVAFGLLSLLVLLAGGSPDAVWGYFKGCVGYAMASAILVSVVHGTVVSYRHALERERRRAIRHARHSRRVAGRRR